MNKSELVRAVAARSKVTHKQADAVVNNVLDVITAAVSSGEKVTLVGFGSFEARFRQGREGRNPQTGEKISIPATKVPHFCAGKLFKESIVF